MADDRELLLQYVHDGAQDAFRRLVERHANWVYSACLRRLRDPGSAEDAAQAVFWLLARNAPSLLKHRALSAWLHHAAGFVSTNFLRARNRRESHERKAAAMAPNQTSSSAQWTDIELQLEPAIDRLSARDRQAILLRFYEQKSHAQIARLLHISEDASHKRVARALDRLRTILSTPGSTPLCALGISSLLAAHAVTPAPSSLMTSLAHPLTSGIPAHLQSFLKRPPSVTQVLSQLRLAAAAAVVLVPVSFLIFKGQAQTLTVVAQITPPAPAASVTPTSASAMRAIFPMSISNSSFYVPAISSPDFTGDFDPSMLRTPSSAPAGHLKSKASRDSAIARANTCAWRVFGLDAHDMEPLRGKRIRASGWVKTKDAANWAGMMLSINGNDKKRFAVADNGEEPLHGNSDWQQIQLVADVPMQATELTISSFIYGPGQLWSDDCRIEIVSTDVPVNDSQGWKKWSPISPQYNAALDPNTQRNGHPTMCISSTTAPRTAWCSYGQNDRHPDKYLGKRTRMTAWIKSEGVTAASGLWMATVVGPDTNRTTRNENCPILGTTDWKQYSVILEVSPDTQCLSSTVGLRGKGKLWVDLESVTYEVLDDDSKDHL